MARNAPLPLSEEWEDPDTYIEALFSFATSSVLFMNLCGGVHILDFLTREPDLYTTLIPEEWRVFFDAHDIHNILHLLMREDIGPLQEHANSDDSQTNEDCNEHGSRTWNRGAFPPQSLLDYIHNIRRLSLRREYTSSSSPEKKSSLPRHIAVGMNVKKVHEVENFSRYVSSLSEKVSERRSKPVSHIVDFGSGQNYLGRTLASSPYHKHIIAIERRHQYISGAKGMDVHAKLREMPKKTVYVRQKKPCNDCNGMTEVSVSEKLNSPQPDAQESQTEATQHEADGDEENVTMFKMLGEINLEPDELLGSLTTNQRRSKADKHQIDTRGHISYIEHDIQDGYLEPIIEHVVDPPPAVTENGTVAEKTVRPEESQKSDARVMVVSLHSCGNLVHHGVRSLVLNPSVVAIAMIGCCYNLLTERLGPATYKLPILRSLHPRLKETGTSYDPHGFPMSKFFEDYKHHGGTGMKLNITARSMAVQAPYNWGRDDSEGFFTRHFYRALLQRILVDRKVVPKPGIPRDLYGEQPQEQEGQGNQTEQPKSGTTALIVGSLRKSAFNSFSAYLRAATTKLGRDPIHGAKVTEQLGGMSDADIHDYERAYWHTKKNLSIVWSLMAFSATVVEALIVVDRWQFLREHDDVLECWVEPIFEYGLSPRNLAVVGIKK